MKFEIDLPDGRLLCVQFVKRGNTVYVRQCADTFFHPTPAQREVRRTLTKAASDSYDQPLQVELANVKNAFSGWVRRSTGNRNKVQEYLKEIFPDDTETVMNYIRGI